MIALGEDVVAGGLNYYLTGDETLVSIDRRTTLLPINVTGEPDQAIENIEHIVHVTSGFDGKDGFRVLLGGEASIAYEGNELAESDLQKGERFGIPVALIILLIIFGAALAALLPILLAIASIGVALGVVSLIGQVFEMSFFVSLMVTMIGLAIGIDYSLLIVSRYREELGRGASVVDAVAKASRHRGPDRAVQRLYRGICPVRNAHHSLHFLPVPGARGNHRRPRNTCGDIHFPARRSRAAGSPDQLAEAALCRTEHDFPLRGFREGILGCDYPRCYQVPRD